MGTIRDKEGKDDGQGGGVGWRKDKRRESGKVMQEEK